MIAAAPAPALTNPRISTRRHDKSPARPARSTAAVASAPPTDEHPDVASRARLWAGPNAGDFSSSDGCNPGASVASSPTPPSPSSPSAAAAAPGSGATYPSGSSAPSQRASAGGAARPTARQPQQTEAGSSPENRPSAARPPTPPNSSGSSTLADALAAGTCPLRLLIAQVDTNVDDLTDSMRDLRVKLELLSRAHERHASMMQSMQSSVVQGSAQLSSQLATAGGSHGMGGGHNGGNTGHVDEMARISEVKAAFRKQFLERMATTRRTSGVYMNTARTWTELVDVVIGALRISGEEACSWLLSYVQVPSRRNPQTTVSMRRCVPILRAKPHMMQTIEEAVLSAYFESIGLAREEVTDDLASLWLDNNAYLESERGFLGMVVSSGEILKLVGASHHIKTPTSIGDVGFVKCLLGIFALASCLVRCFLETKAGLRTRRRAGVGEGIFDSWETELARADSYLPQDDEVHRGLRIIDGLDPRRGFVDISELPLQQHPIAAEDDGDFADNGEVADGDEVNGDFPADGEGMADGEGSADVGEE